MISNKIRLFFIFLACKMIQNGYNNDGELNTPEPPEYVKYKKGGNIMPEFCSSLPSSKAGAKLTKSELIRAIRFMIAAEYEAIGLYTQLVDSIDCEKAKAVLLDIADEERVHAGEFLRLLRELEPEECKFYESGAKEVEELLARQKN